MFWIFSHVRKRDLMRAERTFDRYTVYLPWAGPALRCAQHDHGPQRSGSRRSLASVRNPELRLNFFDSCVTTIESGGKELMHNSRIVPFDEIHGIAETLTSLLDSWRSVYE